MESLAFDVFSTLALGICKVQRQTQTFRVQLFGTPKAAVGTRGSLVLRTRLHCWQGPRVIADGLGRQQRTQQVPRSPESGVRERKTRSTASHAAPRLVRRLWLEVGEDLYGDQRILVCPRTRSNQGLGWTRAIRQTPTGLRGFHVFCHRVGNSLA